MSGAGELRVREAPRVVSPVLVPPKRPIALVVEDVAANRELVETHLADLGCTVRQARDGLEALEQK